jgi:hypothetical protein
MHRYLRTLAITFAGSLLVCSAVANGQRPQNDTETPQVTWKAGKGTLAASSAVAGARVVKDADTGKIRQALPGELPDAPAGRATQIIDSGGGSIAVVGDDLMSDSIAVRNADGSITVTHSSDAKTQPEVK